MGGATRGATVLIDLVKFLDSRFRMCEKIPRPLVCPVDSPHLTHIRSSYRPLMFLSTWRKSRITRMSWDFFTHSFAGMTNCWRIRLEPRASPGRHRSPSRHSRESGNPWRERTGPWHIRLETPSGGAVSEQSNTISDCGKSASDSGPCRPAAGRSRGRARGRGAGEK